MAIDPTLYEGYIGRNQAHKTFKREIVNAKVLFFQIRGNRDHLKAHFEAEISDGRKASSGPFSVCISDGSVQPNSVTYAEHSAQ